MPRRFGNLRSRIDERLIQVRALARSRLGEIGLYHDGQPLAQRFQNVLSTSGAPPRGVTRLTSARPSARTTSRVSMLVEASHSTAIVGFSSGRYSSTHSG